RTDALDAMRDLPASVLEPMRQTLANDPNIVVRERLTFPPEQPGLPALVWRDAVEGRLPPSPSVLKRAVSIVAPAARLIELQHVAAAFRAIVRRDGLTRRHAAVKRALTRWPEATADLMARS